MLALLLVAFVLLSSSSTVSTNPKVVPVTQGRKDFVALLQRLPLTSRQVDFCVLWAYGESRFHVTAHNDSAGEVAASRRAWARVASRFAGCSWPAESYQIGSGGYFGRLVPYFADDMRGVVDCIDPRAVFTDAASVISGIRMFADLQRNPSWTADPTVTRLRAGGLSLRAMADVPPDRAEKYARHARELGLPAAFVRGTVERFPNDVATLRTWYAMLGGA